MGPGRVEGRVAVEQLELAAVDAAGGVDLVEVGPDRVALDGGVDRAGLVEDAADGDGVAGDAFLGVVGALRPGPLGGRRAR